MAIGRKIASSCIYTSVVVIKQTFLFRYSVLEDTKKKNGNNNNHNSSEHTTKKRKEKRTSLEFRSC